MEKKERRRRRRRQSRFDRFPLRHVGQANVAEAGDLVVGGEGQTPILEAAARESTSSTSAPSSRPSRA
jgi:hypothetical protein